MSPDAEETMNDFDPDKVYIIGGIVENEQRFNQATVKQAEKDGIKCLALPIDEHAK